MANVASKTVTPKSNKSNVAKGKAPAAAKSNAKSKTPAVVVKPAAKVGGGRKLPIFSDTAKIAQALRFIADGNLAGFTKAGFSQHHIRQLGKGVSGGMFGPGSGLGFVEMVKDESERPEGAKGGRRPLVAKLTKDGTKRLKELETAIAKKMAKETTAAATQAVSKAPAEAKAKVAKPKQAKPVETPAVETQPASEPAPTMTEQPQTETVASDEVKAA